jgi:hypothetical protein
MWLTWMLCPTGTDHCLRHNYKSTCGVSKNQFHCRTRSSFKRFHPSIKANSHRWIDETRLQISSYATESRNSGSFPLSNWKSITNFSSIDVNSNREITLVIEIWDTWALLRTALNQMYWTLSFHIRFVNHVHRINHLCLFSLMIIILTRAIISFPGDYLIKECLWLIHIYSNARFFNLSSTSHLFTGTCLLWKRFWDFVLLTFTTVLFTESIRFEIARLVWLMSVEVFIRILTRKLGDETMKTRTMIEIPFGNSREMWSDVANQWHLHQFAWMSYIPWIWDTV